ncbi:LuxR C-terminal-related transcriptional regulator [Amycolatopsis mongoliensis]|uniref:LuxR C-terminal-related transcriptional regulator n=1 Tax=Amycolatopsis mongoliensis TaxID=715475 RepID=A0A9Y2JPG3_9PSEU|nr:LuxR family transcriptional regulator [Amycolatopsis sp. 4-36]WIY01002.1 LuxR C-terminal-related transcriptional regulator [Amycolatopsis sp. 4-36]
MTAVRPEIADALARLRQGKPAALLVELDPGTRTADAFPELRAAARDAGFTVVTVTSVESDQLSARSRLLEALAGPGTAGHGPGTTQAAELLDSMSRDAPVVVVVEDAQWSDPATLLALRTLPPVLGHLAVLWAAGVAPGSSRAARATESLRRVGAVTIPAGTAVPRSTTSTSIAFLQVGAVIGVEFALDVAARVLERSVGSLLGEIDAAIAAGTIVDDGSMLRFTDARLRENIYDALPPSARKALHYEVAKEMLRPGTEPQAVWHLTRSTGRLTEADLEVVREAIDRLAAVSPEDAAELAFEVSHLFPAPDPRHTEFTTTAAEHLGNTSRVGEALSTLERVNLGGLSDQEEARLRLVAAHLHQAAGDDTEAMSHVTRALALPDVGAELELALIKTQAVGHLNLGEIEAARRITRSILDAARHSPDPATKVSADLFASQLAFGQAKVTTALQLAEQAAAGVEISATRPLSVPRIPELWLATVLLSTDRADEAPDLLLAGQRHAEKHGLAWSIPYWHTIRAIEQWLRDELDDAAAEAETALTTAERLDITRSLQLTRPVLAMVEADRGNVTHARRLLGGGRSLSARPRTYDMWTAAALIRLAPEEAADAHSWLGRHANVSRLMTLPPRVWPTLVPRGASGGKLLSLLDDIARTAGDQRVVGSAVAAARSASQGPPARRPKAAGRVPWGWDSLTVSELRVAKLVAEGHTNRAIAEQLRVSVHTVGTHLRHAFTKLDINTRVELTRHALQHGVLPEEP